MGQSLFSDICRLATKLGFEPPTKDGGTHARFRHPVTGKTTPGISTTAYDGTDRRTYERMLYAAANRKPPADNAGKYRKTKRGTDFNPTLAARDNIRFGSTDLGQQIAGATALCHKLSERIAALIDDGSRSAALECRTAYEKWQETAAFLAAHHQPVPADPFKENPRTPAGREAGADVDGAAPADRTVMS